MVSYHAPSRALLETVAFSTIVVQGLLNPSGPVMAPDPARPALSANTFMTPTHKDVIFKGKLKLDIFLPETEQPTDKIPALIYVHGGRWEAGDKTPIRDWASKVRDEFRCAVVSIQYRLTGEAPWPAQGVDTLDAIRWVKTNGSKYGIDTTRVGCLGESAGAHLCYYMATAGAANSATRLNVAISMFGQTCFLCTGFADHVLGPFKNRYDVEATTLSQDYFFGFTKGTLKKLKGVESNPNAFQAKRIELVQSAEPLYQLMHTGKSETSPIFIAHGTDDMEVPYEQSVFFSQQLSRFGVAHKLLTIPKGGHAYEGWKDSHILQALFFMNSHL